MKTTLTIISAALLLSLIFTPGVLFSEGPALNKVLYELDDLYYAAILDRGSADIDMLGDAIMLDREGDTLWVGVFITTTTADTSLARTTFRDMSLRSVAQFDNLFSARVRLSQLPQLDRLEFVQSIAPASSRGHTASHSNWQSFYTTDYSKKK